MGALDASSAPEERLAAYRAVRAAGVLPPAASFYLIAWHLLTDVAGPRTAVVYGRDYAERFATIRAAHGLGEDEDWPAGDGPAEHERLAAEFEGVCNQIVAETFRTSGELELADLWRHDRAEFARRSEAGRRYVHGPLPVVTSAGRRP